MDRYTTGKVYSVVGSVTDGWTVTRGNPNLVYQMTDSTDDGQISGRVTLSRPGFDFDGSFIGTFGNGAILLLDQGPAYYLVTNDGPYDNGFTFDSESSPLAVCFGKGTDIATPSGSARVEALRAGDLVLTKDHGPQPIRWIGSRTLSPCALFLSPHLRPIRIREGALGNACPARDLIVSPQHRVLVRSEIAQRMFGADEVLVAAKQLLMVDGVDIADDLQEVEYFHVLFDRHEVVTSNGAETESLFTGPEALKAVGPAAREEILNIFPELEHHDQQAKPARTLPSSRMALHMAARHGKNGKMLVS